MLEIKALEDGTFSLVPTIPVEGRQHPTNPGLVSNGVLLLREAGLLNTHFKTQEEAGEAARSLGYVTESLSDVPTTTLPELATMEAGRLPTRCGSTGGNIQRDFLC